MASVLAKHIDVIAYIMYEHMRSHRAGYGKSYSITDVIPVPITETKYAGAKLSISLVESLSRADSFTVVASDMLMVGVQQIVLFGIFER